MNKEVGNNREKEERGGKRMAEEEKGKKLRWERNEEESDGRLEWIS